MFYPNTGTKFLEPYHLNHAIPRLDYILVEFSVIPVLKLIDEWVV